jgi:hypothetical protein
MLLWAVWGGLLLLSASLAIGSHRESEPKAARIFAGLAGGMLGLGLLAFLVL